MDKIILDYISNTLINDELEDELEIDDDLLGSAILDSIEMVRLIAFIEKEFEIKILPEEMIIENFMTVGHICTFLEKKKLTIKA